MSDPHLRSRWAACRAARPRFARVEFLVIPGRREAASPESITTIREYGFRLSLRSAGMTAELSVLRRDEALAGDFVGRQHVGVDRRPVARGEHQRAGFEPQRLGE